MPTNNKKLQRFRLNVGKHIDTDPHTNANTTYIPGDVFDSYANLLQENRAGSDKFTLVSGETKLRYEGAPKEKGEKEDTAPVPPLNATTNPNATPQPHTGPTQPHSDTFDAMTVDELKQYAQEEEINLKGAKSKEEIIKVLRAKK